MFDSNKQMKQEPSEKEKTPSGGGCFLITLGILLSLLGVYWFIIGEIIIESNGVYATGASARIAAAIWIVVCLMPAWQTIVRVRKKGN